MDLQAMINGKNGIAPAAEQPRLSKEEYAAQKQAEREAVWARVDAQTETVFSCGEAFKDFLNFTAKCNPQRTANLLLLHEQNADATQIKTFEGWQEAGRSVQRGAEGYTFLLGQEYERDDGTKANGYTIGKVFDISQTRGRQPQNMDNQQFQPDEMLAALIESSPVRFEVSGDVPENVQAQYMPQSRTLYVRDGMDVDTTFRAIARELAHATFAPTGTVYDRKLFSAQSYCVAYTVAQRYGMDTAVFNFDKVVSSCAAMDTQSKRLFLSDVKSAVYPIAQRIDHSLASVEHTLVADSFAVIGNGENVSKTQTAQAIHATTEKPVEAPSAKPTKTKSSKQHDAR